MIDTSNWKEFRFGDLLETPSYKGLAHKKEDFVECSPMDEKAMPYVTRTELNNSVDMYVVNDGTFAGIEEGNALVVGDTTATISYQPSPFVCGDHIVVIRAKWLNTKTGLFVVGLLRSERFRYSYGRAFVISAIEDTLLRLPADADGNPDWAWMEAFMDSLSVKPITTAVKSSQMPLGIDAWKEFRIGDLFPDLKRGRCHSSSELDDGEDVWYVGAKKNENGLMRHVAHEPDLEFEGNCIVFICNGQGSVGYALYQNRPFIPSGDLVVGYNDHLNKETGLFLVTVLDLERAKYSFGRKWGKYVADTVIKLPADDDGNPDWAWMEQYMKSLPYGDRIV